MKIFSKLTRKPIAILIAIMMVVGTVTVAFAAAPDFTGNASATFDVKWSVYEEDDQGNGAYVDHYDNKPNPASTEPQDPYIEYAKAEDQVKADVYLESGFEVGAMGLFFALNPAEGKNILTFDSSKYEEESDDFYTAETGITGVNGVFAYYENYCDDHPDRDGINGFYVEITHRDKHHTYSFNDGVLLTFYFTVNDTVAVDDVVALPLFQPYIVTTDSSDNDKNSYTGTMYYYNLDNNKKTDSFYYHLDLSASTAEQLAFGGVVNFDTLDTNKGTIGTPAAQTLSVAGALGSKITSDKVPTPTDPNPDDRYTFVGWSTDEYNGTTEQKVDGVVYVGGDYTKIVDPTTVAEFKPQADADTLYAVYSYDNSTTYSIYVLTQYTDDDGQLVENSDGPIYREYGKLENQTGALGQSITESDASSIVPTTGYTLNTDMTDPASVTLGEEVADNVLFLYYDLNQYTIKWVLVDKDGNTVKELTDDEITGYYGTSFDDPAYTSNVEDPDEPDFGYKLKEWATHENTINGDATIKGELEPVDVRVTYSPSDYDNTQTGTFANNDNVVTKKYGDTISLSDFGELTLTGNSVTGVEYDDPDQNRTEDTAPPATLDKTNYDCTTYSGTDENPVIEITIYPIFSLNTGSIKFQANGGTFKAEIIGDDDTAAEITDNYTYGDDVTAYGKSDFATVPQSEEADSSGQKHDLKFGGWALSTAPTTKVDVTPTYEEDLTYVAIWNDEAVTITFKNKAGDEYTIKRNLDDEGKYTLQDSDYPAADFTPENEGEEWVWDTNTNEGEPVVVHEGGATYEGYYLYDFKYSWIDETGAAQTSDTSKLEENEDLPSISMPAVEGYTFDGWYKDSALTDKFAGENEIAGKKMPAEALTLYGKYTANKYKVNYVVDGEPYTEPDGVAYDEVAFGTPINDENNANSYMLRAEPEKDGYTFSGWSGGSTGIPATMPASEITITGTFEGKTYNIVYVKAQDDDTVVKVITQKVDTPLGTSDETKAPDGSTLSTSSKEFKQWSQELPEKMGIYNGTVAGYENALKIYAIYDDIDPVTITYTHADGREETRSGYPGDPIDSVPTLTDADQKDGYEASWSDDFTTFPDSGKDINVEYTPKDVNVTIDPADGSTPASDTVKYNETIDKPADPTPPAGADFDGWFYDDGTGDLKPFDFDKSLEDQGIPFSENFTVKARYSVNDTYYIATGVNAETGEFTYEAIGTFKHYTDVADETYEVPQIPDMTGFTANGWSLDKENPASPAPDGTWADASREFYALYDINYHTITYIVDGEQYEKFENVPFASEVKRPDSDPEKEGYIFNGWLDKDGKAPGNYETMPDKDLEFTAQWKEIVLDDVVITLYDREGKVYGTITGKPGDPITDDMIPSDPSRFGYTFAGWDPEIPSEIPDENMEINAIWERDNNYMPLIIGGVVVAGVVIGSVAAANAALATGAIIVGGTVLVIGAVVVAKHTHKVTYLVDGEVYRVFYILEGTKVIVPKDPAKDGATFKGWEPEIPDRMPDHDLTFNAQFANGSDNSASPVDSVIPDTGSAAASLAAFAVIAGSAAAAYVITRKKKEDEE